MKKYLPIFIFAMTMMFPTLNVKAFDMTFKNGTVVTHEQVYSAIDEQVDFFQDDSFIVCSWLNSKDILTCNIYDPNLEVTNVYYDSWRNGLFIKYNYLSDITYRIDFGSSLVGTVYHYSIDGSGDIFLYGGSKPEYYTNFDVGYIDSDTGEYVLSHSADFPLYNELSGYRFNETIYTNNYNSVEFEFDISSFTETNSDLGHLYNLIFNISGSLEYMPVPYLVHKFYNLSDGVNDSEIITLSDVMTNTYQGHYQNYFNKDTSKISRSLKLVIPMESMIGSYYDVSFVSDLPFTVIYNNRVDEESGESYIKTIDLTGKYAVALIPKFIDLDIRYNFHVVGNTMIQHRDTYYNENYNIYSVYTMNYCDYYLDSEYNKMPVYEDGVIVPGEYRKIPYECITNTTGLFGFTFSDSNLNQTLFFINHNYNTVDFTVSDDRVTIDYDSRYFSYFIYDDVYSDVLIINPNTNEEYTSNLENFYGYQSESYNRVFVDDFKSAFNEFKGVIIDIFKNVSNFYSGLPRVLRLFYIVIFTLVLFIFLIRFLL